MIVIYKYWIINLLNLLVFDNLSSKFYPIKKFIIKINLLKKNLDHKNFAPSEIIFLVSSLPNFQNSLCLNYDISKANWHNYNTFQKNTL